MRHLLSLLLVLLAVAAGFADEVMIDSFDELRFSPPASKGVAKVVDGQVGKAIEFTFDKDCQNVFFLSRIRGEASWDKAAGLSFWVKGDGSSDVGVLHFIYDDDYSVRYEYAFSLKEQKWHRVTVGWDEFIPVLPGKNSTPLDSRKGNKPSKLSALWVGKWWHWGDYPAHCFALDDLRLETEISRDEGQDSHGLDRIREKLRAGKPVTIVTLGDSLTDPRHWSNRNTVWPTLLKQLLEAQYKSQITIVNPAVGGTQLRQGLIQTPRWLADTPAPDLVTICFGGNDWDAGMRGPQFLETNLMAIKRLRQATSGKADVLVMTTAPSVERWSAASELAAAGREAAKQQKSGLVDLEKVFHQAGAKHPAQLFVDDKVHLSEAGHKLVAETVLAALESE